MIIDCDRSNIDSGIHHQPGDREGGDDAIIAMSKNLKEMLIYAELQVIHYIANPT